jgi:mannosylglycoprotein endo-beta-mannosidase
MVLFADFSEGKLDIYRLNFAVITLVPKEAEATTMKKFRPISLLNCILKIFTKVLTNRFSLILGDLIASNQTAFIKGRYILESVVTSHEVIHCVHSGEEKGDILKLDYEKAFDKVNLDFLDELLEKRGFSPKIRNMIRQITRGGSVAVKINNVEGNFFTIGKGLRQGDPLSPILFNFVVDVFTCMLIKAADHSLIRGLFSKVRPGGIISLQYVDDTILFVENNPETARNLKWVLIYFEQVSRMRINYSKSELIPINMETEEIASFKTILGCVVGDFPIKYLGVPLHHDKLKKEGIQLIIDKILKRIAG